MLPVAFRRRTEKQVERVAEAKIPTSHGEFTAVGYRSTFDGAYGFMIHKIATISMKPSAKPISGASTMKISVLVQPPGSSATWPAFAIAAPA